MKLCKLMVMDFMKGWGRLDEKGKERYDFDDLFNGWLYVCDLIRDGYKVEPFYDFNLLKFKEWCQFFIYHQNQPKLKKAKKKKQPKNEKKYCCHCGTFGWMNPEYSIDVARPCPYCNPMGVWNRQICKSKQVK